MVAVWGSDYLNIYRCKYPLGYAVKIFKNYSSLKTSCVYAQDTKAREPHACDQPGLHGNLLPEKAMTKLEVYFVFNLYSL